MISRLEKAVQAHTRGNLEEAEQDFLACLEDHPQDISVLNSLGLINIQTNRPQAGINYLLKSLQIDKRQASVYFNCAIAYLYLTEREKALQYLDRTLILQANFAKAYKYRADILMDLRRREEALLSYERALTLDPNMEDLHHVYGRALRLGNKLDKALNLINQAIDKNNKNADTYHERGLIFHELKQWQLAITNFERAISLNSQDNRFYYSMALSYHVQGAINRAITFYTHAIELNKNMPHAYNNRGAAYRTKMQLKEARDDIKKAFTLREEDHDTRWNLALLNLLMGEYREGWIAFESRWHTAYFQTIKRDFDPQKLWLGKQNIENKTVVVWCEQGWGDILQFCRYIPLLAERGAKVIFETYSYLKDLMASLQGISQMILRGDPVPDYDFHIPLMSFPLAFETFSNEDVPNNVPYLSPSSASILRWQKLFDSQKGDKLRIGIVWATGKLSQDDVSRSIPLKEFSCLSEIPNVHFYSLQKGDGLEQIHELPTKFPLTDWTEFIQTWDDTAGLIHHLDMVISADTSVAHLAGAMAKPLWIVSPRNGGWRWVVDQETSSWYPTLKLFLKPVNEAWEPTMRRVRSELQAYISSRQGNVPL